MKSIVNPAMPLLGCNGRGVQQSSLQRPITLDEPSVHEQFRLVKESGVFDYMDRLALRSNIDDYLTAIDTFSLPVHSASWFYRLGADDALLADNLRICREIGARCHNIMTFGLHADGHVLSEQEVVDHYLGVYDAGTKLGVEPSFELHVDMWTEKVLQVERVAEQVRRHGVPFNFTLDYSHVIFKMNQPEELARSGIREVVEDGSLIVDPFEEGSLCDHWLSMNICKWTQLRTVGPAQPRNLWHRGPDGRTCRGIQYPMVRPAPGEWHSPWYAHMIEPSKQAIRKTLAYHATHADSPLQYITTEFINLPDYGLGARYDLFRENVEAAKFIRTTWAELTGSYPEVRQYEAAAA